MDNKPKEIHIPLNKKVITGVLSFCLGIGIYSFGKSYYYRYTQYEKHTQVTQLIQIKVNSANRTCWVLARDNHELFEMEFDNDVPNLNAGIKFRDIVYIDHGSYRHLVKIIY